MLYLCRLSIVQEFSFVEKAFSKSSSIHLYCFIYLYLLLKTNKNNKSVLNKPSLPGCTDVGGLLAMR